MLLLVDIQFPSFHIDIEIDLDRLGMTYKSHHI